MAARFQDGRIAKKKVNIYIRILHLVIQIPNLAHLMFAMYLIMYYEAYYPRWSSVFKMVAIKSAFSEVI